MKYAKLRIYNAHIVIKGSKKSIPVDYDFNIKATNKRSALLAVYKEINNRLSLTYGAHISLEFNPDIFTLVVDEYPKIVKISIKWDKVASKIF